MSLVSTSWRAGRVLQPSQLVCVRWVPERVVLGWVGVGTEVGDDRVGIRVGTVPGLAPSDPALA